MTRTLFSLKHFPYSSVYAVCGCSIVLGLGSHNLRKASLRADSKSQEQWPKTRPLTTKPNNVSTSRSQIPEDGAERPEPKTSHDRRPVESGDDDVSFFEDEESAAWASLSARFATAKDSLTSIHWSSLGDKFANQVLPEWALALPDYVTKLQTEIEMGPNSLAYEIWEEAQDSEINPDIVSRASVRLSRDLCPDELAFVRRRKRLTTQALAKYLKIAEDGIDPRDVPTIAVCGSGGGLRALVAGAASYLSAQELIDCATYTAGVSGSCWLQTLYNSSIGGCRFDRVIDHLKRRIGVHIAYPPDLLQMLTRAPTNKYLLSGPVEKLKGDPNADFGLVDVYGLLLAARLLVPKDEFSVHPEDLKLSNQRFYLSDGQNPLPVYAAVRHEIPVEEQKRETPGGKGKTTDVVKENAKREAWFQWFEFTPYELWCEELEGGIPTWSVGKAWSKGQSLLRKDGIGNPEHGLPFLMGIWGSAFCATLAHYYKEVRPIIKGLAGFEGIDDLVEERNEDLIKLHPVAPGAIPNYALGLKNQLPPTCPESIFKDDYLELMDAGMSNNLPLIPLLRKGRNVDIIVCFDASADVKQENWLSAVDGYVMRRGISGWPVGAGWPNRHDETKQVPEATDAASAQQAAGKIAEAREKQRSASKASDSTDFEKNNASQVDGDLGYCNVWVGTTKEQTNASEPPRSHRIQPGTERMLSDLDAGITVVYFPLLPNPEVEGVDPDTSPFLSTWNFIYTPEEIDKVVSLAKTNFEAGKDQTMRTVRAVYERKKTKRLALEERGRIRRWKKQLREHGDHFQ